MDAPSELQALLDAVEPIVRAINVLDTDSMQLMTSDDHVIWDVESHLEHRVLTVGHLRQLARVVQILRPYKIPKRTPAATEASDLDRAPTVAEQVGMAWWNNLSDEQRMAAFRAANTAVPAEAYAHWVRTHGQPKTPV